MAKTPKQGGTVMGKDAKKTRKDRNKKVAVKDLTPKRADAVRGGISEDVKTGGKPDKPGRALR